MYARALYLELLYAMPFSDIKNALHASDKVLSHKSTYDVVTNVDITLNHMLSALIHTFFPNSQILSEEDVTPFAYEGFHDLWILDPLDGTHNFVYGMPHYGIQFCHTYKGDVQFSLIYLPALNEVYASLFGEAMIFRLNDENKLAKLSDMSPYELPKHAYYSFGDFSNSNPESRNFQSLVIGKLSPCINKLRIHGASSIDFAFLCSGRSQLHVLFTRRPWELTPGLHLIKAFGLVYQLYHVNHPDYTGMMYLIGLPNELKYARTALIDLLL